MCGIFCCIPTSQNHECLLNSKIYELLQNRGPNSKRILELPEATFAGFVLWHQGREICSQPIEHDDFILLFNGDLFNLAKTNEVSDTTWLYENLLEIENDEDLVELLRVIEGPFSFIFYQRMKRILYFARDSIGRNSLLVEHCNKHFRILSVSALFDKGSEETAELPPIGLYKLGLEDLSNWLVFPWLPIDDNTGKQISALENLFKISITAKQIIEPSWLLENTSNVSEHSYNFYKLINDAKSMKDSELFENLLKNTNLINELDVFSTLLHRSVKNRVETTVAFCNNCICNQQQLASCFHAKIAILFSGGVDCSILAILVDKYVKDTEPIDLINVAFEPNKSNEINWNVPDRLSAKESYEELKILCPYRKWNFIEVNVTRKELHEQLTQHLKHIIYPARTVLDESIGSAFWFAAKAQGTKDAIVWKSSARVVILGTGADELFGGYVRHRNAYQRCAGNETEKLKHLHMELEKDWKRLPSRNLARDDRVISDTGKTARAPFLEEHLIHYIRTLHPNQRCCFQLPTGVGDKLFLRLYAYRLGLKSSTFLKKRAVQFGSRIANKNQSAIDISTYLKRH